MLNRRGFDDALAPLVEEVAVFLKNPGAFRRQSVIIRALSLLFIDLDNFKPINDEYGHSAGDRALKVMAEVLTQETRSIDLVSRWGGDEFAVALVGASSDEAVKIAQKLSQAIKDANLGYENKPIEISLSIGIASLAPGMNLEQLFKSADQALHKAKRSGKNRISS